MADDWPKEWPDVVNLKTFDPNGDLLLQLMAPVVEASLTEELPHVPHDTQESDIMLPPSELAVDLDLQQSTRAREGSDGGSQLGPEDQLPSDDKPNIYLRVSSRHLILASAMFKAMLSPDKFLEGNTLRSQGNLIIELPDNPDTMIVLMYIVHGLTRKVPRDITLETMTGIAKLVDYYYLHEVVELFSDTWVVNLKEKASPKSYTPDVIPLLFNSWVFHKADLFKKITQLLISGCDEKMLKAMEHEGIPIPSPMSKTIREQRDHAIDSIITVLHDYIANYLTPKIVCDRGSTSCDANVVGTLMKSAAAIGLWPRPKAPYRGMTFSKLATQIRQIEIPDSTHYHRHGVQVAISASVKSLEDQFCGLKLDLFWPGKDIGLGTQIEPEKKVKKSKKGKKKARGQNQERAFLWEDLSV